MCCDLEEEKKAAGGGGRMRLELEPGDGGVDMNRLIMQIVTAIEGRTSLSIAFCCPWEKRVKFKSKSKIDSNLRPLRPVSIQHPPTSSP